MKEIKTIGIFGAGTMGQGIAQCFLQSNRYKVIIFDKNSSILEKAEAKIKKNLEKLFQKKIIALEPQILLRKLNLCPLEILEGFPEDLEETLKHVDFAIEAVFENLEVKKEIFSLLDKMTRPEVILSSNTSSIPISQIAAATKRPDKVCGMHFMNPAPLLELVEAVKTDMTSAETIETIMTLVKDIGKTPVLVKDSPGFVLNRILIPMINEAIAVLENKIVAEAKDVDTIMTLGAKQPIGPLALADLIGLDICLAIMEKLHRELGDKYKPANLLKEMVNAGKLGRKTKEGFYRY